MWTLVLAAVLAATTSTPVLVAAELDAGTKMVRFYVPDGTPPGGEAEALVRQLAKDGLICQVYGHRWNESFNCYVNNVQAVPSVYTWPSTTWTQPHRRQCAVCGRREIRSEEWREDK